MALLTIKEACEVLRISRRTLYEWRKTIPAVADAVTTPDGVRSVRFDAAAIHRLRGEVRTDA